MTATTGERDRSLDTLRGLAILFVLVGHYSAYVPVSVGGMTVNAIVYDFGQGGVLLFFLLSGFLIELKGHEHPPGIFLIHRLFKIVPAYWVNVLFLFAAGMTVGGFEPFAAKDTAGNLLFMQDTMGIRAMSGVYWTLVVEVKFYVLFVVLFYGMARFGLGRWFDAVPFAVVAANLGLLLVLGRTSLFLAYLPAFFVGAAIGRRERGLVGTPVLAAVAAVALVSMVFCAQNRQWQAAVFLAVDILVFLWARQRAVSWRPMVLLGLVSYSVYLYHTSLGYWLFASWERWGMPGGWPLRLAVVTAVVLAVSTASWRFIETPMSRLGRMLSAPRRRTAFK